MQCTRLRYGLVRGRAEAASLEAPDEPVFSRSSGNAFECPICTEVTNPPTQALAN